MQFFSGFSLKNDVVFFDAYLSPLEYTITGFSYGAIKAFEETYRVVMSGKRVERLQLFSPAFFQTKSDKFKRMQLMGYKRSPKAYLEAFVSSCFAPYEKKSVEHCESHLEELNEVLFYKWNIEKLRELEEKGVAIEIYLGEKDSVIDVVGAREFFLEVGTVTYIKNANHFLQTK